MNLNARPKMCVSIPGKCGPWRNVMGGNPGLKEARETQAAKFKMLVYLKCPVNTSRRKLHAILQ